MKHICGTKMNFKSAGKGIVKYACPTCRVYVEVKEEAQAINKHTQNVMRYGEDVALHLLID